MTIAPARPSAMTHSGERDTGRIRRGATPGAWVLPIATLAVAGGTALTLLPLHSVFTDSTWYVTGIGCALPYWISVALLRRGGTASWHSLVGLLASGLMLMWVFVPQHLGHGVLPTPTSFVDLGRLFDAAGEQIRDEHAPVQSTHALRLISSIAFIVVAILADLLAIVLRHPLLAGAPLLEVLAVSAAIASKPAHPAFFASAAIGFLIILLTGTRLQDREWGPSVDGSAGRLGGARRIAIGGIAAALLVPLILPSVSVNLLSKAAHFHDGSGGGIGNGQVVLSGLASLRGSLDRANPQPLFNVTVPPTSKPFYVRSQVLDAFRDDGWQPSPTNSSVRQFPLAANNFPVEPNTGPTTSTADTFRAEFEITNLGGSTLPLFADPEELSVAADGNWLPETASVELDRSMRRKLTYGESVRQLEPTAEQLRLAGDFTGTGDPAFDARMLSVPNDLPAEVVDLATRLTSGKQSNYERALAIYDYFQTPANGFLYTLDTAPADGRSAIVQFLATKRGFCQQYAAATALMMRAVNIPARVVVGFTHAAPTNSGTFTVTTADAHAWVEVYFPNIGWIPFDTTPLSGIDAGRAVPLPWSPTPSTSAGGGQDEPTRRSDTSSPSASRSLTPTAPTASAATGGAVPWQGLGIAFVLTAGLAGLVFGPRLTRARQRTRRFDTAHREGDPESVWVELAATAHDRGLLWPRTVTVGQVSDWLGKRGLDDRGRQAVREVARGVERTRYSAARTARVSGESVTAVSEALRRWERRDSGRRRWLNKWWPPSLRRNRKSWER